MIRAVIICDNCTNMLIKCTQVLHSPKAYCLSHARYDDNTRTLGRVSQFSSHCLAQTTVCKQIEKGLSRPHNGTFEGKEKGKWPPSLFLLSPPPLTPLLYPIPPSSARVREASFYARLVNPANCKFRCGGSKARG